MVSAFDFRSDSRWFDAQSLPSCCFLRQETLPQIVFLHPAVIMGIGDLLLGVGSNNTLSCFILQKLVKLRPSGPPVACVKPG